jgi:hypothetical protein
MICASVFSALGKDFVFGLAARHEVAIHANIPATYYLGHWLFPPGAEHLTRTARIMDAQDSNQEER